MKKADKNQTTSPAMSEESVAGAEHVSSNINNGVNITPQQTYQLRQRIYRGQQTKLVAWDNSLAMARGTTFLLVIILAWLSFFKEILSPIWLLGFILIFISLVVIHAKIARRLDQNKQAVAYYARRLEHMAGNWSGQGNNGKRYRDDDHPYTSDLDIFAEDGLFEHINGARTRLGEDALAKWLCSGVDLATIIERQKAIGELKGQVELFEKFALLDDKANVDGDQNRLRSWCSSSLNSVSKLQLWAAILLGVLSLISAAVAASGLGYVPFLAVILLQIGFYSLMLRRIKHFTANATVAISGLTILSQVMKLIEQNQFETPLMQQINNDLQCEGRPPSWQIRRLNNLAQWLENSLRNQFFAPVAFLVGVPLPVMALIDRWRERVGPSIPEWLAAIGQMEALCSMARYAFENPNDPFPDLVQDSKPAVFEAEQLCHPLIPKQACVANDIRITSERCLIMVSGSNMSGKSTLLRTIGINLVLASCGAPVRAKSLVTSRFQIGCAMRANDSLQRGVSLFYSVISRIKCIVELAGKSPPLFFLLDEILQGTNSHDRRIGAEGIIRQLLDKNSIGLVTTHDLALTEIVNSLRVGAVNIHFEDHLENGQMHFDYKIQQGVVQKSNALELMRMIGLEVKT